MAFVIFDGMSFVLIDVKVKLEKKRKWSSSKKS